MMRMDPVTPLLQTEPEKVTDFKLKLLADNTVKVACRSQKVYGNETKFELSWNSSSNSGENQRKNECNFTVRDLSYLTKYTFKVSKPIKVNVKQNSYIYIV